MSAAATLLPHPVPPLSYREWPGKRVSETNSKAIRGWGVAGADGQGDGATRTGWSQTLKIN